MAASTMRASSFSPADGESNDCICTSSLLTTPPTPSLVMLRWTTVPPPSGGPAWIPAAREPGQPFEATAAQRVGAVRAGDVAGRRGGHAPADGRDGVDLLDEADGTALGPGRLAERREVRADLAGRGAVVLDWNEVAETKRNGTPASRAIALAVYVFPVPGAPSNRTPRRGVPPMLSRNVAPDRNRSSVRDTSARDPPQTLDVVERDVDLVRPEGDVRAATGRDLHSRP